MSIKKNLLKNGLASAFQKVIKIAEQLLLVPFFISAWGAAYYGEWLTLTIIPTIIGFSDLGFGTSACNFFILKYASDDKQGAANISKSGFLSVHIIVFATIIISSVIMILLNHFNIFDKSIIPKQDAILAIAFLMLARILGFYQPINEAYFRAARKAALSINLLSAYSVLNLIVGFVVLFSGQGIVIYAFSNLVVAIIYTLAYTFMARKTLPINKEFKGRLLKSDIRSIFHKGLGFLLLPVWQALFFQGTTFVVRLVLGPVAVTVFNTVRTLTRAVNQANAMVISSVLPELQYELGAGRFSQARKIFRFGLAIILSISLGGMLFLFLFGPWFYEVWTHKELNPPTMMWNMFIIGIVFSGAWWLASDVLIAANKPFEFTIAGTIAAAVAVLASYFLSLHFGLTGAAIGSLFLDVSLFLYVFPVSCKLIKQPILRLFYDLKEDYNEFMKKRGHKINTN